MSVLSDDSARSMLGLDRAEGRAKVRFARSWDAEAEHAMVRRARLNGREAAREAEEHNRAMDRREFPRAFMTGKGRGSHG